mmetsp:Transcript_15100/g.19269  ORF Transcript_15100/g.19269 Transcript_15100/m.19269 type:complete len:102 (+) Transcript_15100:505-810(+)
MPQTRLRELCFVFLLEKRKHEVYQQCFPLEMAGPSVCEPVEIFVGHSVVLKRKNDYPSEMMRDNCQCERMHSSSQYERIRNGSQCVMIHNSSQCVKKKQQS